MIYLLLLMLSPEPNVTFGVLEHYDGYKGYDKCTRAGQALEQKRPEVAGKLICLPTLPPGKYVGT